MSAISETNLILNQDGSVYHLGLIPENVSETIITVGDPDRVEYVSRNFDSIEFQSRRREFVTHTGRIGSRRLSVVSTGIGTDNVEIVLNELDALFNIDLRTRVPNEKKKSLQFIRIGTAGGLRKEIPLDTHLISDYAVGLDNLMSFYTLTMAEDEKRIARKVQDAAQLPFLPSVTRGDAGLRERVGRGMVVGNTVTCPGFYAPQGRELRVPIRFPSLLKSMGDGGGMSNFEMETSGYFSLGRLLGHQMASVSAILANRVTETFSRNPAKAIDSLILKVLENL